VFAVFVSCNKENGSPSQAGGRDLFPFLWVFAVFVSCNKENGSPSSSLFEQRKEVTPVLKKQV
jgi:hypothetical protein